jgi:hypothetical protein
MISLARPVSIQMVHLTREAAVPLVREAHFQVSELEGVLGQILTSKTCSMLSPVGVVLAVAAETPLDMMS